MVASGFVVLLGPAVDLEAARAENQEFLSARNNEKWEMIILNDRLTKYIERVKNLNLLFWLLLMQISLYPLNFTVCDIVFKYLHMWVHQHFSTLIICLSPKICFHNEKRAESGPSYRDLPLAWIFFMFNNKQFWFWKCM